MRYGSAGTVAALAAALLVTTLMVADRLLVAEAAPGTASISPDRVLDTRVGVGAPTGRVSPGQVLRLTMPADVTENSAVSFNLTATDAGAPGFVTTWPCGSQPDTSNLNVFPGVVSTNLAIVGMTAGDVCLSSSVEVHLIADLMGTFAGSDDFRAATPSRIVDTREDSSRLDDGEVRRISLTQGDGYQSATGGVALNVTVVNPGADGYVTIYPCGDRPLASTVNYRRGDIVPNFTIVSYGAGEVCAYTSADTDLVIDSFGWSSNDGELQLASPSRIVDTRSGDGWNGAPPSPASTVRLRVAGIDDVPLNAQGVLMTLVATDATADGYVTVYPCDAPRPEASILNLRNGAIRANLAFVPLSATDGEICMWVYTTDGSSVGLVGDVVGWTLGGPGRAPAPTTTTTTSTTTPGTTTPGTTTTTMPVITNTTSTTIPSTLPADAFVETFETLDRWVFAHRRYEQTAHSDAPSTATIVNGQARIVAADQNYGDANVEVRGSIRSGQRRDRHPRHLGQLRRRPAARCCVCVLLGDALRRCGTDGRRTRRAVRSGGDADRGGCSTAARQLSNSVGSTGSGHLRERGSHRPAGELRGVARWSTASRLHPRYVVDPQRSQRGDRVVQRDASTGWVSDARGSQPRFEQIWRRDGCRDRHVRQRDVSDMTDGNPRIPDRSTPPFSVDVSPDSWPALRPLLACQPL